MYLIYSFLLYSLIIIMSPIGGIKLADINVDFWKMVVTIAFFAFLLLYYWMWKNLLYYDLEKNGAWCIVPIYKDKLFCQESGYDPPWVITLIPPVTIAISIAFLKAHGRLFFKDIVLITLFPVFYLAAICKDPIFTDWPRPKFYDTWETESMGKNIKSSSVLSQNIVPVTQSVTPQVNSVQATTSQVKPVQTTSQQPSQQTKPAVSNKPVAPQQPAANKPAVNKSSDAKQNTIPKKTASTAGTNTSVQKNSAGAKPAVSNKPSSPQQSTANKPVNTKQNTAPKKAVSSAGAKTVAPQQPAANKPAVNKSSDAKQNTVPKKTASTAGTNTMVQKSSAPVQKSASQAKSAGNIKGTSTNSNTTKNKTINTKPNKQTAKNTMINKVAPPLNVERIEEELAKKEEALKNVQRANKLVQILKSHGANRDWTQEMLLECYSQEDIDSIKDSFLRTRNKDLILISKYWDELPSSAQAFIVEYNQNFDIDVVLRRILIVKVVCDISLYADDRKTFEFTYEERMLNWRRYDETLSFITSVADNYEEKQYCSWIINYRMKYDPITRNPYEEHPDINIYARDDPYGYRRTYGALYRSPNYYPPEVRFSKKGCATYREKIRKREKEERLRQQRSQEERKEQ